MFSTSRGVEVVAAIACDKKKVQNLEGLTVIKLSALLCSVFYCIIYVHATQVCVYLDRYTDRYIHIESLYYIAEYSH